MYTQVKKQHNIKVVLISTIVLLSDVPLVLDVYTNAHTMYMYAFLPAPYIHMHVHAQNM